MHPWSHNLSPANQKSDARAGGSGNRKKSKKMRRRIAQAKARALAVHVAPKKRTWRAVSSMSRVEVEAWFCALPNAQPKKKHRKPTATQAVVRRRVVVRF